MSTSELLVEKNSQLDALMDRLVSRKTDAYAACCVDDECDIGEIAMYLNTKAEYKRLTLEIYELEQIIGIIDGND